MNGISSATTIPTFPGASSLSDADLWEHYYAMGLSPEAAQQHVLWRQRGRQAVADNPLPPPKVTSPEAAALLGASRTATSGFGDELLGALEALRGKPPQNTAQQMFGVLGGKDASGPMFDSQRYQQMRDQIREQQAQAMAEHPKMSVAAGAVGAFANPLNYLLGPATRAMSPIRQGATVGATLGLAQGTGEGTSAPSRIIGALQDAVIGAGTGGIIGGANGIASKLWRSVFRKPPTGGISESAIRAQLAKLKFTPEQTEQAVTIWRQGGILPAPAPPTTRPGETVTPENLSKPTFMRRGGTVRQDYNPATGARSITGQSLPDIGRGKTLPYYPRGGKVEQAFGAAPAPSPTMQALAPQQVSLLRQFLKGATPGDLASRLDVIRALGIPLPPDAEAQLLPILVRGTQ